MFFERRSCARQPVAAALVALCHESNRGLLGFLLAIAYCIVAASKLGPPFPCYMILGYLQQATLVSGYRAGCPPLLGRREGASYAVYV